MRRVAAAALALLSLAGTGLASTGTAQAAPVVMCAPFHGSTKQEPFAVGQLLTRHRADAYATGSFYTAGGERQWYIERLDINRFGVRGVSLGAVKYYHRTHGVYTYPASVKAVSVTAHWRTDDHGTFRTACTTGRFSTPR